jgi:hypothetical protein
VALTDLSRLELEDASFTLPIRGRDVRFVSPPARLGRALRKAVTTGTLDQEVLPDSREANEYRLLFGEHYTRLLDELSDREWEHVANTLVAWVLFGADHAELVWEGEVPNPLAARRAQTRGRAGSAGAPATKTASTSTTNGAAAPRRRRPNKGRR